MRMLCHLKTTKNIFLTLEADNLNDAMWWGDTAFAVHPVGNYREIYIS